MSKDPVETVEVEVVFTGRGHASDNKIGYRFILLKDGKLTDTVGFYTLKKSSVFGVGVYGVKVPKGKEETLEQIFSTTLRWKRNWEGPEAAEWDAEDTTFMRTVEALKLAKASKGSEITKLCAPLARLYQGLSPFQRSAFMTLVLNEVSSPTKIRNWEG